MLGNLEEPGTQNAKSRSAHALMPEWGLPEAQIWERPHQGEPGDGGN